ncbi:MAG: hypothetical protein QOH54_5362 [Mycobacterium sp.]|nr:hypothetical protein [Mycobacterium sp.]
MDERAIEQSPLKRAFEQLLSTDVRLFLGARGFTQRDNAFRRSRGPLYDVIGFQGNWHNGSTPSHGYFINVGIGSTEVDSTWPYENLGDRPLYGCLLDRRWESVVPDLPYEIRFGRATDTVAFADALCESLGHVIAVFDEFDCTSTLVRYAVENNLLIQYERTCCYLAAVDDGDTLIAYVGLLHDRFGHQERWSIFSRRISEVTGAWTSTLVQLGLLEHVDET